MPNVDTEHFPHDAVRRTQFMINPCLSVYDHLQYGVLSMGCAFALRTPSQCTHTGDAVTSNVSSCCCSTG